MNDCKPVFRFFRLFVLAGLFFSGGLMLSGCSDFMDFTLRNTVDPDIGSIAVAGIDEEVVIRRDDLGVPVIEAKNFQDLAFATGYVMASDRLAQMISLSLLGQGRLSEMAGDIALDMDVYVRTLGGADAARQEYASLNPDIKKALEDFSAGVNAYIRTHEDRLPMDFMLTRYSPEPWEPVNSLYIVNVYNLGLSFNLSEEINYLNIAKKIGPMKSAWLIPIYPDEPLGFEKAKILETVAWDSVGDAASLLASVHDQLNRVMIPLGTPASNNWGIAPAMTRRQKSIIANDTHLPLEQPSLWMLIHMKSPGLDAGGIAIAGVPGIVAGYNGHIAWGETMVMGDNQDIFIEKIKKIDGRTHYLYQDAWYPVEQRKETFKVKDGKDVVRTVYTTRHGPLLNSALKNELKNVALPAKIDSGYGLALQSMATCPGQLFDGMFQLMRSTDMDAAHQAIRKIRGMALNFIYGDADRIAWQVSGRYPLRKSGRGHLPSPGWTGEFDWTGYVDPDDHPYEHDPVQGYLLTANHRTVTPDQDLVLSSSWYSPERAERIETMIRQTEKHTWEDSAAMHKDRVDPFFEKFKHAVFHPDFIADVRQIIDSWENSRKMARADEALIILKGFDGNMLPNSAGAAVYSIFRHEFIHNVFKDELEGEESNAWKNFISMIQAIYPADQDHLIGRADSPLWDNVETGHVETRAEIIADTMAKTISTAEQVMGKDRENWAWGSLLTYSWQTQTTRMKEFLPAFDRFAVGMLAGYTDRGPYPAGGNYNTLNVSGFHKGADFNVWLVPAMRMIVDFGLDEPMMLTNSGGQSGNPASDHYDDAIDVWLNSETRSMPFGDENIRKQYDRVYILAPKQ